MSNYIIETNGLTRRFGQHVSVDHIDLRVPEGKNLRILRRERCRKNHDNPYASQLNSCR